MGSIVFVGMEKATIAVAVAEGVRGGEVRQLGIFPNRAEVIAKLAGRLAREGRELKLLLRGRPLWLRPAAAARGPRSCLRGGGAVPDFEQAGRPGEDRPA